MRLTGYLRLLAFCLAMPVLSFASPYTPKTLTPTVTGLQICGAISCNRDGRVYISEWSKERVGIYDLSGLLIEVIDGIGDPSGNVFDPEGNFYVSSYSYGRVWQVKADGKRTVYAQGFDVPAGLAWYDGCLYVCNRDAGEIVRVNKDGTQTVIARGLPQPVALLKLKGEKFIISCLTGSPRLLSEDGSLTVFIPEISASGINIVPDGENAFFLCVISEGTVERITLDRRRTVLASGFSTPIGMARCPDGRLIFDAWGQGAAYLIDPH